MCISSHMLKRMRLRRTPALFPCQLPLSVLCPFFFFHTCIRRKRSRVPHVIHRDINYNRRYRKWKIKQNEDTNATLINHWVGALSASWIVCGWLTFCPYLCRYFLLEHAPTVDVARMWYRIGCRMQRHVFLKRVKGTSLTLEIILSTMQASWCALDIVGRTAKAGGKTWTGRES